MAVMDRVRSCVRAGRYEFTVHSLEEMDEDSLDEADVRKVLLSGTLAAELTDDPRGTRYVVRGVTTSRTVVEVVCRLLPSRRLRVITVYTPED